MLADEIGLRPYVVQLRDAMVDMSSFVNKPGTKMRNRWLPAPAGKNHVPQAGDLLSNAYDPFHYLERRAWDVARYAQRLHTDGPA